MIIWYNVKKNVLLVLACALAIAALQGCAAPAKPATREFFAMDTLMTLSAWGGDAAGALDGAEAGIRRLDAELSCHDPHSEISAVNAAAGAEQARVSAGTMELLRTSKEYGALTGGALDVSIGPLSVAWDFGSEAPVVPSDAEIASLLPLVGYGGIELDMERMTARLPRKGMRVDLGAVGKGYASDMVMEILGRKGVKNALFNLGGNVGCLGGRPGGGPWRIGLRDPNGTAGEYIGYVSISSGFVVTSGDYERYFIKDGIRYHHILDPSTGRPVRNGVRAVSIVAQNGTLADACSTALFVMGPDRALEFRREREGFEAVFVMEDGRVIATPGARSIFTFTGKDAGYAYGD